MKHIFRIFIILILVSGCAPRVAKKLGCDDLFQAAQTSNEKAVQELIDSGCNVNEKKNGRTPLMIAVARGDFQMVNLLVRNRADVNMTSDEGWTALMDASGMGNAKIVKFLIDNKAEVDMQIKGGALAGTTALMWAVNEGNYEVIKILIDAGANVDLRDDNDKSAMSRAYNIGVQKIIDLLRKAK